MKDELAHPKRSAPAIVWCVRLCCLALIYTVTKFWPKSGSPDIAGWLLFGGFVAMSIITFIASFIRSRLSIVFLIIFVITIPLIIFLGVDIMLRGAWWEWLIAFPVQMGIPLVFAFYLWKAPFVREFYSSKEKSAP